MDTKFLTGLALIACVSLGSSSALADSEASSMAGGFNEGAHSSFAEQNLGGGTLMGNNSESGGVFGVSGSSFSAGPRSSTANTESGGAAENNSVSSSGGASLEGAGSQSGMTQLWNSLSYGTVDNTDTAGSVSQPAEQPAVKAHVPSISVRTYHWPASRAIHSYYAYRTRSNM